MEQVTFDTRQSQEKATAREMYETLPQQQAKPELIFAEDVDGQSWRPVIHLLHQTSQMLLIAGEGDDNGNIHFIFFSTQGKCLEQ